MGGRLHRQPHTVGSRFAEAKCKPVGATGPGLGEEASDVDEGQEGGHHDLRSGDVAPSGADDGVVEALVDINRQRVLEGTPAVGDDSPGQSQAVAVGVEVGLVVEADGRGDRERQGGRLGEAGGQPKVDRRRHLLLDLLAMLSPCCVGERGGAVELAVDGQLADEAFDLVDGPLVGLSVEASPVLAVVLDQLGIGQPVQRRDLPVVWPVVPVPTLAMSTTATVRPSRCNSNAW